MAGSCYSSTLHSPTSTFPYQEFDMLINEGCNCSSIVKSNNLSNVFCEEVPWKHPLWLQISFICMFAVIILLGTGGNIVVIWIVLAHRRMRTVTNYFLLNLAIADASISVFNVSFSFTFNLYYNWYFGPHYCVFNNFMSVTPTCASVFTLMSMSLERYMAIMHPLKRRPSGSKTIAAIVLIWVCASVCGLPMLLSSYTVNTFFYSGKRAVKDVICQADSFPDGTAKTSKLFELYNYFLLVITYILPLCALTVTFLRVGKKLWWGHQMIGDHRHEESIRAKQKVVKMMIVIVTIFMICWAPYHIYFTLLYKVMAAMHPRTALYIYLNIYWLAMSSSVYNPFIYCWMNSRFRIGFRYALRWLPCIRLPQGAYAGSDLVRGCRKTSFTELRKERCSLMSTQRASANTSIRTQSNNSNGMVELKEMRTIVERDEG